MIVSHELPLKCLYLSEDYNDYEYFLPHLAENYKEYEDFFKSAKDRGRYIIMDNSLHELGNALDDNLLLKWLNILEPNEFIIPDVWEDKKGTIDSAIKWSNIKVPQNTTKVVVAQGLSYFDIVDCINAFKILGYKKFALSYGASLYLNCGVISVNKDYSKMMGRLWVVEKLVQDGVLNPQEDRLHLLGCSLPQEFGFHKNSSYANLIESIDTSSPIMAALDGVLYSSIGLEKKPLSNMNTTFDKNFTKKGLDYMQDNMHLFRQLNNL